MRPSAARVALVVVLQVLLLALVPARQVKARLAGREITLATAPVDPFDAFAGHYVTLAYHAEQVSREHAPAGLKEGQRVWVTLEQASPAWRLVSVRPERPAPAADQVSIATTWHGLDSWARADIPADRFYLPEEEAQRVDRLMAELRVAATQAVEAAEKRGVSGEALDEVRERAFPRALVDLRVDEDGTIALVRLRVAGERFDW